MFQIIQNYLIYYCNLSFESLMEYLSKKRGRNCLDKWSSHKLSFVHMYRKRINAGNIRNLFGTWWFSFVMGVYDMGLINLPLHV